MKTRLLPLASLSLLVAALGACGSDDGDDGGTDTGSSGSGLDSVDLDRELGCGFGFARADEAGTALLWVSVGQGSGTPARAVNFPDPGWSAEARVGSDLTANWCTDVIVEPQAEVDETWQIVEGTLRFVGAVPRPEWTDNPETIRAELTDVVAESPDGEQVELGDFTLHNSSWGSLPG